MRYLLVSISFAALLPFYFCLEAEAQQYSGFGWQQAQQNSFNGGYSGLNTNSQQYYQSPQRNPQHNNAASLEQKLQAVENSNSVGWYQAPAPPAQQMQAPVQANPNNRSGMFPGISKKEAMRIFFEGGTPDMGGSGSFGNAPAPSGPTSNPAATSNAYSNYQRARNEETKKRKRVIIQILLATTKISGAARMQRLKRNMPQIMRITPLNAHNQLHIMATHRHVLMRALRVMPPIEPENTQIEHDTTLILLTKHIQIFTFS